MTSSAEPTRESVQSIVIRVDRLEFLDRAGDLVNELTFAEAPEPAVEQLTATLGAEPVITDYDPKNHGSFRVYDWSGLRLIDNYESRATLNGPTTLRFSIETASVGNIAISTVQGVRVGDSVESAHAALGNDAGHMSCWGPAAEYGPGQGESLIEGEPQADGVEVAFTDDVVAVRALVAPQRYGAGCE